MGIFRSNHDKQNPYVILCRSSLWDQKLSLDAVGLWARILSRPDGWKIYISELAKSSGCGKDKIYRIVNELIENGYAYRWTERKYDGRIKETRYEIFETKKTAEQIEKMFPRRDFPDTEKPDAENPPLSINDSEQIKKSSSSTHQSEESPPIPKSISSRPRKNKEEELPANAEEEEELQKRLKNRPKGFDPIRNMVKWRKVVLKEIRSAADDLKAKDQIVQSHKAEAYELESKSRNGTIISACRDRLEVSCGTHCCYIPYDQPDEDWKRMVARFK